MTNLYKRVPRNLTGRDIIAGDVHGYFTKLGAALSAIMFSPEDGDRLFFVGDLVDRGPESLEATEWLAKPWVHAVRGNHEQWAMDHVAGRSDPQIHIANGGAWFIGLTREEQREIAHTFEALPLAIELETTEGLVGIVHAECPFNLFADLEAELQGPGMRAQTVADVCMWSRGRVETGSDKEVLDVRAVVVGHTPVREFTSLGNHLYIDTGAWRGREFTLLDAATLQPVR